MNLFSMMTKHFKFKKYRTHSLVGGFTLVETLVAITILLITVSSAFSAVTSGMNEALLARDNITAYYLAREAVEYIKNQRDTNNLAGNNWLTGIAFSSDDPCYLGNKCVIDAVNNNITACDASVGCPVMQSNSVSIGVTTWSYAFGYGSSANGWSDTNFKREVTVTPLTSDITGTFEIRVTIKISWYRSGQRTFTVDDYVYNWQK